MKISTLALLMTALLWQPVFGEDASAAKPDPAAPVATVDETISVYETNETSTTGMADVRTDSIIIEVDSDEVDQEEVAEAIREAIDEIKAEWSNLPPEEREELKRTLKEGFKVNVDTSDLDNIVSTGAAIAIATTAILAAIPVSILFLIFYFSHRRRRQRNELITKFIENGQEVPPQLLPDANNDSSENRLQSGVRLTCIGAGLFLFFGFLADWSVAAIGFIPMFIGIGKLVLWKLEQNNKPDTAV